MSSDSIMMTKDEIQFFKSGYAVNTKFNPAADRITIEV